MIVLVCYPINRNPASSASMVMLLPGVIAPSSSFTARAFSISF
jgi:hypothetical protein